MRISSSVVSRSVAIVLTMMLVAPSPFAFAAARRAASTGSVSGIAVDARNHPLDDYSVRLRNLETGAIEMVAATQDAAGQFLFTALTDGRYMLELVDAAGRLIAVSAAIVLSAVVSNVGGVTLMSRSTDGAQTGLFRSTAVLVLTAAAAAGLTAGVLVSRPDASPSK